MRQIPGVELDPMLLKTVVQNFLQRERRRVRETRGARVGLPSPWASILHHPTTAEPTTSHKAYKWLPW